MITRNDTTTSSPYIRIAMQPRGGALGTSEPSFARVNPQCDISRVRNVFVSAMRRRSGGILPAHQALFFQVLDPRSKTSVPVFDCNNVAELAQRFATHPEDGSEPYLTLVYQCENTYG